MIVRPTLEEFLAILEVHARLEGQVAGLAARRLSRQSAEDLEAAVRTREAKAEAGPDSDPVGYCRLTRCTGPTMRKARASGPSPDTRTSCA